MVGEIDLSNSTNLSNVRDTFRNCTNITNINMTIPNSISSTYGTFYRCWNVVNFPSIPDSVVDMTGTFQQCHNATLNNSHISNNVTQLYLCFQQCYNLSGDLIIPQTVVNMRGTFSQIVNRSANINVDMDNCINLEDMSDCFNKATFLTSAPNMYNCVNVQNVFNTFVNCQYLTGDIIFGSNQITNAIDCFNNTSLDKNVYIPFTYQNGDNTLTYNSFINAGYGTDPTNRVNGVCLYDLATYQN